MSETCNNLGRCGTASDSDTTAMKLITCIGHYVNALIRMCLLP